MTDETRELLIAIAYCLSTGDLSTRAYIDHGVFIKAAHITADALVVTFDDGRTLELVVRP